MHVLVTGGCGYVGSVLVGKLLAAGHRVRAVDVMWFGNHLAAHPNLEVVKADIRETQTLPMAGVEAVVHLAAVANDPCVELDPALSWEVNTLATMRLADRAAREGVRQFVFASTSSVYGVKEEPRVTEDLTLVPVSAYNRTKMVSERVMLSYADDMIVQVVRPATVCGLSPRLRLDLTVNLLTVQALKNGRITVHGGAQYRPNIHIEDVTDLYVWLLERGGSVRGVYNAGFENATVMEIAEQIASRTGAKVVVEDVNDPRSYRINSDKLLAAGFVPKHSYADAITDITAAWRAGTIKDEDVCYNIRWMQKAAARAPHE